MTTYQYGDAVTFMPPEDSLEHRPVNAVVVEPFADVAEPEYVEIFLGTIEDYEELGSPDSLLDDERFWLAKRDEVAPRCAACHKWSHNTAYPHEPNHDGDGLTDNGCTAEGCYCEGPA